MNSKNIILKDAYYGDSNTALNFKFKNINSDDEDRIFYFDVSATYEDQKIYSELAIFESEIEDLRNFEYEYPITEIYFIEPDLHLTIIDFDLEELCIYVDFDSGLRHSNMGTESGLSLKLKVTKEDFNQFLKKLTSIN